MKGLPKAGGYKVVTVDVLEQAGQRNFGTASTAIVNFGNNNRGNNNWGDSNTGLSNLGHSGTGEKPKAGRLT